MPDDIDTGKGSSSTLWGKLVAPLAASAFQASSMEALPHRRPRSRREDLMTTLPPPMQKHQLQPQRLACPAPDLVVRLWPCRGGLRPRSCAPPPPLSAPPDAVTPRAPASTAAVRTWRRQCRRHPEALCLELPRVDGRRKFAGSRGGAVCAVSALRQRQRLCGKTGAPRCRRDRSAQRRARRVGLNGGTSYEGRDLFLLHVARQRDGHRTAVPTDDCLTVTDRLFHTRHTTTVSAGTATAQSRVVWRRRFRTRGSGHSYLRDVVGFRGRSDCVQLDAHAWLRGREGHTGRKGLQRHD
eukprot:364959-Chlamydomonas_euryale.AAC.7